MIKWKTKDKSWTCLDFLCLYPTAWIRIWSTQVPFHPASRIGPEVPLLTSHLKVGVRIWLAPVNRYLDSEGRFCLSSSLYLHLPPSSSILLRPRLSSNIILPSSLHHSIHLLPPIFSLPLSSILLPLSIHLSRSSILLPLFLHSSIPPSTPMHFFLLLHCFW